LRLLVAESVLFAALRTVPENAVAGHAPEVFIHAGLADGKPAPAGPGEHRRISATVTGPVFGPAAALSPLCGNV